MATFRNKRDTLINWLNNNPVLEGGVIGFEEDSGKFKMGNGVSTWMELPYYLPETDIGPLIEEYVSSLPTGEVTQQDLSDHIHSSNPHPEYDSGTDWKLVYENVKAG